MLCTPRGDTPGHLIVPFGRGNTPAPRSRGPRKPPVFGLRPQTFAVAMKSTYRPVLRKQHPSRRKLTAADHHNSWQRPPRHADPERLDRNQTIRGGTVPLLKLVEDRLSAVGIRTVRKNGVMAVEFVASAGQPFFDKVRRDDWIQAAMDYFDEKFGRDNVVQATLHLDEKTPHLHVAVVPLSPQPDDVHRFRSADFFDATAAVRQLASQLPFVHRTINRAAKRNHRQLDASTLASKLNYLLSRSRLWHVNLPGIQHHPTIHRMRAKKRPDQRDRIAANRLVLDHVMAGSVHGYTSPTRPAATKDLRLSAKAIFESLAATRAINPHTRKPIGNPTQPYLHRMQVEYYDLCHRLDDGISPPRYGTQATHQSHHVYHAERDATLLAMEAAQKVIDGLVIPEPSALERISASAYAQRVKGSIVEQLAPLVEALREKTDLKVENECQAKALVAATLALKKSWADLATARAVADAAREEAEKAKREAREAADRARELPLKPLLRALGYSMDHDSVLLADGRQLTLLDDINFECASLPGVKPARLRGKGAIDLVSRVTGLSVPEAVNTLNEWAGRTLLPADVAKAENAIANHFRNDAMDSPAPVTGIQPLESFGRTFEACQAKDYDRYLSACASAIGVEPGALRAVRPLFSAHGHLMLQDCASDSFPALQIAGLDLHGKLGQRFHAQSGDVDHALLLVPADPSTELVIVRNPLIAAAIAASRPKARVVIANDRVTPASLANALRRCGRKPLQVRLIADDKRDAESFRRLLISAAILAGPPESCDVHVADFNGRSSSIQDLGPALQRIMLALDAHHREQGERTQR